MKLDYMCPCCEGDLSIDESVDKIECPSCHKTILVNWDCDEGKDATTLQEEAI